MGLAATIAALAMAPNLAPAGQRPIFGGELRRLQLAPMATLDPVHARTFEEIELARNLHATLVERADDGTFHPYLAASFQSVGAPPALLRLEIPPGLTFHGGQPLTAAAAVASLGRLFAVQPWLSRLPGVPAASGIRAAGATTIEIDLPARTAEPVLEVLSHPMASITLPPDARGIPPGAGPFALAAADPDHRLRLVAFPGHVRGRPFLDAVTITAVTAPSDQRRALEGGAWDVIDLPAAAEPPRGGEPISAPGEETVYLEVDPGFAFRDELTAAAAAILDRAAMVSVILKGRGSVAWRLPGRILFPAEPPPSPPRPMPPAGGPRARAIVAYPLHDTDLALAAERVKFELRAYVTLDARGLPRPEVGARRPGQADAMLGVVFLSPIALPIQLTRELGPDPPDVGLGHGDAANEGKQIAALAAARGRAPRVPLFHRPRRYLVRDGLIGIHGTPWGPPSYADAWRSLD